MNLTTTYLGLKLRTPLVPSASPLFEDLDNLKRLEDAGASAIILHSLFEEQIRADRSERENEERARPSAGHLPPKLAPPAKKFTHTPDTYLHHLTRAKECLGIPVIASLNGTTFGAWTSFGRELEQAGADALELNLYSGPTDSEVSADSIEQRYLTIAATVKAEVSIPVAVKIGPWFTNLALFARRLERQGADGLVLFNRFYQPDIDLETGEVSPQAQLSTSHDARLPLRWIALLRQSLRLSLAATSGVHRGADALKLLMCGADVTMLCSALLRHGINHLWVVEREMKEWMEQHGYESVGALREHAGKSGSAGPAASERAQYIRTVGSFHSYEPATAS